MKAKNRIMKLEQRMDQDNAGLEDGHGITPGMDPKEAARRYMSFIHVHTKKPLKQDATNIKEISSEDAFRIYHTFINSSSI